jgi:hypothetical protein
VTATAATPEGFRARYMTVGGLPVTITDRRGRYDSYGSDQTVVTCAGCGAEETIWWGREYWGRPTRILIEDEEHALQVARAWAQAHAKECGVTRADLAQGHLAHHPAAGWRLEAGAVDAQFAAAHALVAIQEVAAIARRDHQVQAAALTAELAATRAEIAGVAAALRQIAAALPTVAAPIVYAVTGGLEAVTTALEDLTKNRDDIARVGLAVDGLAAEVADLKSKRSRRRWWGLRPAATATASGSETAR